jgi:hypothetical protein
MTAATEKLYSLLTMDTTDGGNWRDDHRNYYDGKTPSGSVNISPAWFQQGHEVSVFACQTLSLSGSLFQMRRRCNNTRKSAHHWTRQQP